MECIKCSRLISPMAARHAQPLQWLRSPETHWSKSIALRQSHINRFQGAFLMRLNSKWNRRSFLGSVGVLAGSILAPRKLFSRNRAAAASSTRVTGFGQSGNPYEELGVPTVINCEGTMTVLGGSLPHPELQA